MRFPDQHLSADELELLGEGDKLSGDLGEELGAAREHVQSCPACRRKLEVYPMSSAKLEKLRAPRKGQKGPDCPPIGVWLDLAGGLLNSAEQERYSSHAAQCDHCGPILRQIIQDFSQPVSEEEAGLLSTLENRQTWLPPGVQQQPCKSSSKSLQVFAPQRGRHFRFPLWAATAAALAICAALLFAVVRAGFFGNKENTVASITQLLGKAYAEQRITELRIPEGQHGPIRIPRSAPGSQFSSPPALLKAEGSLASALEAQPDNPELLRRKAEAELLRGNYQEAATTLNSILNRGYQSSAVLEDLGIACFESAEDKGLGESRENYKKSLEYLSQALKLDPGNSSLFFNRAIVDEKLLFLDQAIADWNQFLRFEHDRQWISEGAEHLATIQGKKKLAP